MSLCDKIISKRKVKLLKEPVGMPYVQTYDSLLNYATMQSWCNSPQMPQSMYLYFVLKMMLLSPKVSNISDWHKPVFFYPFCHSAVNCRDARAIPQGN